MKPAVGRQLDAPSAVNRRSFFRTVGISAACAMALTDEAAAEAAAGEGRA